MFSASSRIRPVLPGVFLLFALGAQSPLAFAQQNQRPDLAKLFDKREVMIPVRDGVELHTVILRPEGSDKNGAPLPFLMTRTPYGVSGALPESVAI